MKNMSELMVDLAYSAVLFNSKAAAEEVITLENEVNAMNYEIKKESLVAARSYEDAEKLTALIEIAEAAESMANAAKDLADLVIKGIKPHPVFKVVMEPLLSTWLSHFYEIYDKNCTMCEWLSIVAQDGIGDIDYSNVRDSDKCDLIYGETEATVKFEDCLPPNVKGVEPVFNIYATDSVEKNAIDWKIPNATVRWGVVSSNGTYERCSDWQVCSLKDDLEKSYKNRFFARGGFGFYLNEGSGIDGWETAFIDSKIISIR